MKKKHVVLLACHFKVIVKGIVRLDFYFVAGDIGLQDTFLLVKH